MTEKLSIKTMKLCITAAILLSTGCTSTGGASQSTAAAAENSAKTAPAKKDAIKIEEIDWKVEPSVIDDERCYSLNYTNHSPYTIMELKIKFTLKSALSEEQRALFDDIKNKNTFILNEEDDYTDMYLNGDNRKFADPEETVTDSLVGINGWLVSIETEEQYQLFEPDIMTIVYIGDDDRGHGIQYDFKNKAYGTYQSQITDLHEWGEGEMAQLLPSHQFPAVMVSDDDSDSYEAFAYGVTVDEYNTYIDEVKANGFDTDVSAYFPYFSAKNADGISCSVSIWPMDEMVMIIVKKE